MKNTLNRNREDAMGDFIRMVEQSWTFGKMTDQEKTRCFEALRGLNEPKGSYAQRWEDLNNRYNGFLLGLGYDDHTWRQ